MSGRTLPQAGAREALRRDWPFLATLVLPFLLITVTDVGSATSTATLLGMISGACALGAWLLLGTRAASRWIFVSVPLLYLLTVALVRHATGGAASGFGALALVPVVFAALRGRRFEVMTCVVAMGAMFVLPVLVVDGSAYPFESELRRAVVSTVVALLIAVGVTRIVNELARREQTTRNLLDRLPGTVVVEYDPSLQYLDIHGSGLEVDDGVDWRALVGRRPADFLEPDRAGQMVGYLRRGLTEASTFEWDSVDAASTHLVSVGPWQSSAGAAGILVSRDITQLKRAQRAAEQEHLFLNAVLDTIQDGVVALDAAGDPIVVNRAMREVFRQISGDPDLALDRARTGAGGIDLQPGAVSALGRSPVQRALLGETVRGELITVPRRDGSEQVSEVSASPIVNARSELIGAVATVHDVTERREVDRMKEHFFALVSHELRTPLASVLGYLAQLREEEGHLLTDDGREFLDVMQRNGDRLLRLISDLLLASQIGAEGLSIERGSVDLGDLVAAAYRSALPNAAANGHTLTVAHSGSPTIVVEGDGQRLGQVVDNLVANAIKFVPQGGSIELRLGRSSDGRWAHIDVRDDGPGIDPAEHEHIFTRFARGRDAESGAAPGAGLGLWISHAIVTAHGGDLTLESLPGQGARFRIALPTEPVG